MRIAAIVMLILLSAGAAPAAPVVPGSPVEIGDATLYRIVSDGATGVDVLMGATSSLLATQRVDGSGLPYWGSGPVTVRSQNLGTSERAVADGTGGMIFFVLGNPLRLQRANGAGATMWMQPGVSLVGNGSFGAVFDLVADGSGGAIAAWDDGTDIRAQRVDSLGHVLWGASGVVVCNATGLQISPQMCRDASGGVIIAWQDPRAGGGPIAFAQRLNGSGVPQWAANGISLGLPATFGSRIGIVADGVGGASVLVNTNGSPADIAQRLSPSGALLWGAGVPLPGATVSLLNSGTSVPIASDGTGGLVVAWAGTDNLIHAHRVSGAGALAWGSGGLLVAPSLGIQSNPTIVSDGAGGAVMVWQDQRNPGFGDDLYAQRLDGSGLQQWSPAGVAVCDAPGAQSGAQIAPASDGSIVIVWTDGRRSNDGLSAIYCQRLSTAGVPLIADRERPAIAGIRDVAGDQGGRVRLRWTASGLDTPSFGSISFGQPIPPLITGYRVWRRVPESQVAALRTSRGTPALMSRRIDDAAGAAVTWWEAIGFVPFEFLPGYGFTASTSRDSMAGSNPYTAFFVTAVGRDSALFYPSNVDSGYSVDNLAPPPPSPFTAGYQNAAVHLHWRPSAAEDFSHYELNRGDALDFAPSPANLIDASADTGYADAGSPGHYYKLTAVDVHGNRSAYVQLRPQEVSDVPGGTTALAWALGPATPNPSHGTTSFALRLPPGTTCNAGVYDAAGRRVRQLVVDPLGAGARIEWNGLNDAHRPARAGLYFVRVTSGARQIVRPVTLIR